jgi:hypothetical protein
MDKDKPFVHFGPIDPHLGNGEVPVPALRTPIARDGSWFLREALVLAHKALDAVHGWCRCRFGCWVVIEAVVAVVGKDGSSIMTCTNNITAHII